MEGERPESAVELKGYVKRGGSKVETLVFLEARRRRPQTDRRGGREEVRLEAQWRNLEA